MHSCSNGIASLPPSVLLPGILESMKSGNLLLQYLEHSLIPTTIFAFTPYTSTMGLSGILLSFATASSATLCLLALRMTWVLCCLPPTPADAYTLSLNEAKGGVVAESPFPTVFPATASPSAFGIAYAACELGALDWCSRLPRSWGPPGTLSGWAWLAACWGFFADVYLAHRLNHSR